MERQAGTYAHGHQQPLGGYLGLLAAFVASAGALIGAGRAHGDRLPRKFRTTDVVLGAVAVHKFARLIAKDAVTSPIRAPFTRFEGSAGSGEVNEEVRGEGNELRRGLGEVVSCPFCLSPWISTGYVAGLVLAPRAARTWATVFGIVAGSDALQHVYARLRTD